MRGVAWSGAGPAARGALIAAVLLAIFVPLLASADAAFTQLLDDLSPDTWAIDMPFARALVLALFTAAGGALIYARLCPPRPLARPAKLALGRLEWALPLGALVVLFAAFVALQFTTLFGGERHVVDTAGLTYAEYARSGFAQLLAVAALTLAVIAAARRWARDDGQLLNALIAALCLLTLVVLISALEAPGALRGGVRLHAPAAGGARRDPLSRRAVRAGPGHARPRDVAPARRRRHHRARRCCCSRSATRSAGSPSTTSSATSSRARSIATTSAASAPTPA